ncbi:FixH family protein [Endozoicomonas sp. SM1973]|uniref:FixH family protein n=1 Tax=Spartinivicinus marinus TaxID=2994442 RepID=A0A853I681_9GAMM|nr:FixH family protein [Spartinivicinus marinus]MCX4030021.1 FixH family protein [Spartinivicinus marinus]NYZ64735.1 FixH family protein [Spartinivicinus marinus]
MQTSEQTVKQTVNPWYKEFWFWFVMAIPMLAIASGIAMITVSINGADTLVRDNYYKDGLAIRNDLSRDYKAKDLQLVATIKVDNLTGDITVKLAGNLAQFPTRLSLSLISPTIPDDDQSLLMQHIAKGHYVGQLKQQVKGKRYIQLETIPAERDKYTDNDWRLISDWYLSNEQESISLGNNTASATTEAS